MMERVDYLRFPFILAFREIASLAGVPAAPWRAIYR